MKGEHRRNRGGTQEEYQGNIGEYRRNTRGT